MVTGGENMANGIVYIAVSAIWVKSLGTFTLYVYNCLKICHSSANLFPNQGLIVFQHSN